MTRGRINPELLLFLLCGIFRAVLMLCTAPIFWPDSRQYFSEALALLANPDSFAHEIYHTPVYPLFLAGLSVLSPGPDLPFAVLLAQHLIGLVTALVVFDCCRRLLPERRALLAALVFGLSPLTLYYETVVQTETLFLFFFWIFVWSALRWLERPEEPLLAAAAGVSAAVTMLVRPVAQYILLCLLLASLTAPMPARLRVKGISLAAAICLLSILPWMYENQRTLGFFGISKGAGLNLYLRAVELNEGLPPRETREPVVAEYRSHFQTATKEHTYMKVFHALQHRYGGAEADRMMFRFALDTALSAPLTFLADVAKGIVELIAAPDVSVRLCWQKQRRISFLCAGSTVPQPEEFAHAVKSLGQRNRPAYWIVARYFRMFQPIVQALLVVGFLTLPSLMILRCRSGNEPPLLTVTLLFLVCVGYFCVLSEVFNKPEDRYRLPIDPMLLSAAFAVPDLLRRGSRGPDQTPAS